jgi:short-subunit dehydrogenase
MYSAVVVTGGSSGIGKSFIELAAKLQPSLRFCNLSRTSPRINSEQLTLCHIGCDLGKRPSVVEAAKGVEAFLNLDAQAGRVLLINNSGFGAYGCFPEPNLEHQLDLIDVNIRGLVQLTGLLLPVLKERGGTVMNIASTAAFQPTPYMATYGASKAFVLNWTLALNAELRGSGVNALAVCPGPTATEFYRRAGLQKGSVGQAFSMTSEAVVMSAFEALGKQRSFVVPGWKNKLSTWAGGIAPKQLATRIAERVIAHYKLKQVKR